MKSDGGPAPGSYALEVVSIREHGVTCKVAGGVEGGFATLPKHLVESALAAAGKALVTGATFCLTLTAEPPLTEFARQAFTLPQPGAHMAGDSAPQSARAPENGSHA